MLSAQELKLGYDDKIVVPQLSLAVDTGRMHCLTSPSGCGLKALLRALAGPLRHGLRREETECYRHRN